MVFLIIGNDFDESLLKYKNEPGHSYFAEDAQGALALRRIDYHPSFWRRILRSSALVRYVTLNTDLLNFMLKWQHLPSAGPRTHSRSSGTQAPRLIRLEWRMPNEPSISFPASVTKAAGLPPHRILFAVDGMRPHIYDARTSRLAAGSYFDLTRQYFMKQARQGGFEVLDLQPRFVEHVAQCHRPLEFATDNHWNSLGHEVVAEAIAQSNLYTGFRRLVR